MSNHIVPILNHAIHNNAIWCDTVCRAHGTSGEFRESLWVNRHPVPMFYSNVLRLSEGGEEEFRTMLRELLASNLPKPWSIKDGFGTLDLRDLGFRKLFDASWIVRYPSRAVPEQPDPHIRWSVVDDERELVAWEAAWSDTDADATPDQQPRLRVPAILTIRM